jgi:tetracycline 7-halogenase / FADH2 O2-dependent halogenase
MTASPAPAAAHVREETYDVAILGSGIGGSMLAAILARHGVRTLLVDAGTHPRCEIGESASPYALVALRTLAARYDVPDINAITRLENCTKMIAPTFGVNAHAGFLNHREGRSQDPHEVSQLDTRGAHHLFRQDSDAYVFHAAIKHGAVPRQGLRVADIDLREDGITLLCADGSMTHARYVVDASGASSPLAEKLELRETPSRFKHHSRSLWTHVKHLTPTDDLFARAASDTPPRTWYTGTVHHTFERGWFWVIGFDNTPRSRAGLCSIGLTLDERAYPNDPHLQPAEDFARHAARFPDIERQYRGAVDVREWTSTDRQQWSSTQTIGDRWCLLGQAAGFVDQLFSQDLATTCDAINALAWRLLAAVKDDDFSAQRFSYVDELQQRMLDCNDALVNAAFTSWTDHDLWSAVFRVWACGANAATHRLREALTRFRRDGDDRHFLRLERPPHLGLTWPDHDGYAGLFEEMVRRTDAVQAGEQSSSDAADALFGQLVAADFVSQPLGIADRRRRFIGAPPKPRGRTALWAAREADPVLRRLVAGIRIRGDVAPARPRP